MKGATAAIGRYLIESIDGHVELRESQGGAWITIRRNISRRTAKRFGFNLHAMAVEAVFADAESDELRRLAETM